MTTEGLRWAVRTDVGRVRQQNEDTVHADGTVFVVADGMGGHLAGEVASALAVSTIASRCAGGVDSLDQLGEAVREANRRVIEQSNDDPEREGMGTTVVAAVRMSNESSCRLALVNVGDSRAYRFDGHRLLQLSRDHSLVQELVDDGIISPSDARHHPRRNIVTRALGIDPDVQLDLWETTVEPGQRILLCSDGLVDEVDEPTIESILRVETEAESAADRLVELANEHGGRDNISLVIFGDPAPNGDLLPPTEEIAIPIEKPSNIDAGTPSTRRIGHRAARVVLATATALALTVMLVLALIWVRSGFVVTFDDDQVVVLRGREVLWFEPTQVAVGPYERNELDRVSQDLVRQAPRFDRLEDAETFVAERLVRDQTFAQDAGIDT